MIGAKLLHRVHRGVACAAFALLAGCSSSDKKPLLLLQTPLQDYPDTQVVAVTVTTGSLTLAQVPLSAAANARAGKYGIYLTDGFSGKVAVAVAFLDGNGCTLALGGEQDLPVKAGEASGPYAIPMQRGPDPCTIHDGGPADALPAVNDGGGRLDGGPSDATSQSEAGPSTVDVAAADEPPIDLVAADGPRDVTPSVDVPADAFALDTPLFPEVTVAVDAPADNAADLVSPVDVSSEAGTTLSVLHTCTSYTHTEMFSTGPGNWGVRQIAFTPDNRHMVSFGEDGRAKVWDVTLAGLVENPSGLLFTGQSSLYGDISADGTLIAVGDGTPSVTVYDLAASLTAGGAAGGFSLPTAMVTAGIDAGGPLDSVELVAFTKDGKHLVVAYLGYSQDDPNYLVLWSLSPSPSVVTKVPFPRGVRYWATVPGSYPGKLWVVAAGSTPTDGGYRTTLSLVDLGQDNPTKLEVMADSTPESIAVTPDATTIYLGFDSGELGTWDISDKTRIVPKAPSLITASAAAWPPVVYALATSSDGQYVAAGTDDDTTAAVKLFGLAKNQNISKAIKYMPWTLSFAPDNLALAVGEGSLGTLLYCTP